MSQHDQVIDNGSGLSVRTDINAAMAALFSSNSGPIEPGTIVPGQLWFDTANPAVTRLAVRNGANTAWQTIASLDDLGNFSIGGNVVMSSNAATGLQFTAADIGFGARPSTTSPVTPNRWVWNDKPDLSGTDVGYLTDTGRMYLARNIALNETVRENTDSSIIAAGRLSCQTGLLTNAWLDNSGTPTYKALIAGYAFSLAMQTNGVLQLARSSVSMTPGGSINFTSLLQVQTDNVWRFNAPGQRILVTDSLAGWSPSVVIFSSARGTGYGWFSVTDNWFSCYSTNANGDPATRLASWRNSDGAFIQHVASAYKPGGGTWGDSSDERIKNVIGNYEPGLDEVLQLQPVRYTFKGNDTEGEPGLDPAAPPPAEGEEPPVPELPYPNSMHYGPAVTQREFIGLIAQAVEPLFPEMVTKRPAYIDGEQVDDLRDLDTTSLIFALINSIKTLTARVEALEAGA